MKETRTIVSFAVGFLAGALCVSWWLSGDSFFAPLAPTPSPEPATTQSTSTPRDESGAVSVNDQGAGMAVLVESVTVPPPGVWVAVRELDGTNLGNVLGAARVQGPRTSVTVPLLRATEPGTTYAAELYRDNGDDQFDLSTDSVYIDFTTTEPVITYFHTNP